VVPLIFQTLGVVAAGVLLRAMFARAGAHVQVAQTTAFAAVMVLAFLAVGNVRERWKELDVQRTNSSGLAPETARATCTGVGVDNGFLELVGSMIPVDGTFYMEQPGNLTGAGDICIRLLLMPRRQVSDPAAADYLVFWGTASHSKEAAAARARGVKLRHFRRDYEIGKARP
jgi:hypothetical protein